MGEAKHNRQEQPTIPLWQRRSATAAVVLFATIYPLLYLGESLPSANFELSANLLAATLSLGSLAFGLIGYLKQNHKAVSFLLRIAYLLLLSSIVVRALFNPDLTLIDITLWSLSALFAGAFGLGMITLVLALATGYLAFSMINMPSWFDPINSSLSVLFPALMGAILWHQGNYLQSEGEDKLTKLKSQLGTEASKSNIVIQAIDDGVVVVDPNGNISLINPAASLMVGWDDVDATGLSYQSVIRLRTSKGDELSDGNHPVRQGLTTNKSVSRNDCEIITASNKKIPVVIHVSPLTSDGKGVVMVFRDITDEIQDNRQKAEFISTASHEMRTPVASIEGYIGLALNPRTSTIDDKAREYLQKAHRSAQHLGRLFKDLLDITRAEDGRLNTRPVVVNLTDAMREYVSMMMPIANEKQLKLSFKPDSKPGAVNSVTPVYYAKVDRDHLREVVSNLIENAIKYTPSGEVSVDINGDKEHVVISVKDSGIGIAKEDVAHIFEKFYRVDNTDAREIGGTGLGLYLCRRLAEAMNGRLWAQSRRGEGSQFFLELDRLSSNEATKIKDTQLEEQIS